MPSALERIRRRDAYGWDSPDVGDGEGEGEDSVSENDYGSVVDEASPAVSEPEPDHDHEGDVGSPPSTGIGRARMRTQMGGQTGMMNTDAGTEYVSPVLGVAPNQNQNQNQNTQSSSSSQTPSRNPSTSTSTSPSHGDKYGHPPGINTTKLNTESDGANLFANSNTRPSTLSKSSTLSSIASTTGSTAAPPSVHTTHTTHTSTTSSSAQAQAHYARFNVSQYTLTEPSNAHILAKAHAVGENYSLYLFNGMKLEDNLMIESYHLDPFCMIEVHRKDGWVDLKRREGGGEGKKLWGTGVGMGMGGSGKERAGEKGKGKGKESEKEKDKDKKKTPEKDKDKTKSKFPPPHLPQLGPSQGPSYETRRGSLPSSEFGGSGYGTTGTDIDAESDTDDPYLYPYFEQLICVWDGGNNHSKHPKDGKSKSGKDKDKDKDKEREKMPSMGIEGWKKSIVMVYHNWLYVLLPQSPKTTTVHAHLTITVPARSSSAFSRRSKPKPKQKGKQKRTRARGMSSAGSVTVLVKRNLDELVEIGDNTGEGAVNVYLSEDVREKMRDGWRDGERDLFLILVRFVEPRDDVVFAFRSENVHSEFFFSFLLSYRMRS